MTVWLTAAILGLCAVVTVVVLIGILRDQHAQDRMFVLLAATEVLLVLQLIVGSVALAQTERDVEGVLFVSYLVGIITALPIGAFWSLAERSRAGSAVVLLAVLTVVALQIRLIAIWGG